MIEFTEVGRSSVGVGRDGRSVAVRDEKWGDMGTILVFSQEEWAKFMVAVITGNLMDLLEPEYQAMVRLGIVPRGIPTPSGPADDDDDTETDDEEREPVNDALRHPADILAAD